MSRMSNLDAELREAGIDPEKVYWDDIEAYRQNRRVVDGVTLSPVDACVEWYSIGKVPK